MRNHHLLQSCRATLYGATLIVATMLLAACSGGSSTNSTNTSTTTNNSTSSSTTDAAYPGYNLYAPLSSTTTYLIDNSGNILHSWASDYRPGLSVYLLTNGELLRTGSVGNSTFTAGGAGGIVQTLDWNGTVTWQFQYSSSTHLQHHDVAMLPNGHILMIAWEYKTASDAVAQGRDPGTLSDGALWADSVIEVDPTASAGNEIVWQWHVWDHLIQDYDSTKPNYGTVAAHPERINLNYASSSKADWTHINSITYNPQYDQILLSVHNFSEIWVIDHSTTSAEAAGHSGGNSGKGGDLLYRWGNPRTYDATASVSDQQLFGQHDAEWIETGLPGAGDILVFNNGTGRSGGNYSSVDEIAPPVNSDGSYTLTGTRYGPDAATWRYTASTPTDFYAQNISSAQRLPNGDTLICNGPAGDFFEVTSAGKTVWDYNSGSSTFRVKRYNTDYAGFAGTSLATQ